MSSVIYPVSAISSLSIEYMDGVLSDQFDDGSVNVRRRWAAQRFKRRFRVQHAPLSFNELKYLRSFYAERNGGYDSFFFRDNVNREGNAVVRFADRYVPEWSGGRRGLGVILEETSPVRALPSFGEVTTAAGTAPLVWYDANREIYYKNAGETVNAESTYWDVMQAYRPTMGNGVTMNVSGSDTAQYQSYASGTGLSKARASLTGLTGLPWSIFCVKTDAHASWKSCWMAFGAATGDGFGLHTSTAGDTYCGVPGGSAIGSLNTTIGAGVWASFAIVATSTAISLYANGALVATNAQANTFSAGYFSVFNDPSFDTIAVAGNLNHMMLVPAAMTLAQVKAVHNLVGYQYGIATVA